MYRFDATQTTCTVVIINVYCPRAESGNADRLAYKLQFYHLLQVRAEAMLDSGRLAVSTFRDHFVCFAY